MAYGSFLDSHVTATVVFANSPYAVQPRDNLVKVNAVGGAVTLRTPTATGKRDKRYRFVKVDASANEVTVANLHLQTYSGASSFVLAEQWEFVEIHCDGANWLIVGHGVGIDEGAAVIPVAAETYAMDPDGVVGDFDEDMLVQLPGDGKAYVAGFGSGSGAATHVVSFKTASKIYCVASKRAASVAISGALGALGVIYVDDDGTLTFTVPVDPAPIQKAGYAVKSLGGGLYEADLRPDQDWTV